MTRKLVLHVAYYLILGIPLAKKKIAEVELAFLHLQQNVEIPEITLPIPQLVQNAIIQVTIATLIGSDDLGTSEGHPT
jgi:dynein cytoplasmic 1 heavy chain